MDFGRRVTRSAVNENAAMQGKLGVASKPGATRRLALAETKNVASRAVAGKDAVAQKPIARPVRKLAPQAPKEVVVPAVKELPPITDPEREVNCADFSDDIYEYLMALEKENDIDEGFLSAHNIQPKMRAILVDWLVQVHQRFHLLPETLHLTIYLLDRYLTNNSSVEKSELQLVGVSCMFVASKYEEMYSPEIQDFEFITDNTFTKKQIMRMEIKVLSSIGFDLSRPHSITLLRWLSKQHSAEARTHNMAKYIGELAMVEYSVCHLSPSYIAAASLYLSSELTRGGLSKTALAQSVGLNKRDMEGVVECLARAFAKLHAQPKLRSVRDKYEGVKMGAVAHLTLDQEVALHRIGGL